MATPGAPSGRERPGRLLRLFFKLPVVLYRGRMAERFRERHTLLLTTAGRRTRRPRTVAVNFLPRGEHLVIVSGWGERADWYRNLLAQPDVGVQVGRRRFRARAEPIRDPAASRELALQMGGLSDQAGPPRVLRPLLRRCCGFDFDDELAALREGRVEPLAVELVPL